jgi:membrane protease YdiL (CAAX protease family)
MPWDFWLILFVLSVLLPWRGRARLQSLLAMPQVGTVERLSLYASTIAFQWLAVAVAGWRAWARGLTAFELGLVIPGRARIAMAAIVGAATLAALQWLNLRRMGRLAPELRGFLQALAERILPQSSVEFLSYLALAVTAGVCEEFLYRGFAMAALARTGLPVWGVVLLSSVLFGMAHLYQGRSGLVSTLLLGVMFAVARITYHSLAPIILWHVAVDVVAGMAGPRYLVRTAVSRNPSQI